MRLIAAKIVSLDFLTNWPDGIPSDESVDKLELASLWWGRWILRSKRRRERKCFNKAFLTTPQSATQTATYCGRPLCYFVTSPHTVGSNPWQGEPRKDFLFLHIQAFECLFKIRLTMLKITVERQIPAAIPNTNRTVKAPWYFTPAQSLAAIQLMV